MNTTLWQKAETQVFITYVSMKTEMFKKNTEFFKGKDSLYSLDTPFPSVLLFHCYQGGC